MPAPSQEMKGSSDIFIHEFILHFYTIKPFNEHCAIVNAPTILGQQQVLIMDVTISVCHEGLDYWKMIYIYAS